jgi:hypothetical protein
MKTFSQFLEFVDPAVNQSLDSYERVRLLRRIQTPDEKKRDPMFMRLVRLLNLDVKRKRRNLF